MAVCKTRIRTSKCVGETRLAVVLLASLGLGVACGGAEHAASGKIEYSKLGDKSGSTEGPQGTDPATGTQDIQQICAGSDKVEVKLSGTIPVLPDPGRVRGLTLSEAKAKLGDKQFSMADLKALEKKQSWLEILQHLEDIAPAQRNADWDKLLEKSATEYLASLSSNSDATEGFFTAETFLRKYPTLEKSKEYMARRADIGKTTFTKCFAQQYSGDECLGKAQDFLKVGGKNPELAMELGRAARKSFNHYAAVPFFRAAVAGTKDSAMCADEDLGLAVTAGLGLPPDQDNAVGARDVAANACWTTFKQSMATTLKGSDGGGYFKTNACAVLRARGDVK